MLVQDIRTTLGYVAVLPSCVVVGGEAPRSLFPSPRVPAVVLVRHQASEVVLVRGLGIPSLAGLSGWRHAHSACVLVPDFRSCAFIIFCGAKKNKRNFADYFLLAFLFVNALQCNIYAFINFKCWGFFFISGGGVIFKGSGLLLLLLFWGFFPYLVFWV